MEHKEAAASAFENFPEMFGRDLAWIEVSMKALKNNLRILRDLVGPSVVISPCLKSNAYGHGLKQVGLFLQEEGIDWFCVDSLEEAEKLREAGVRGRILILGYVQRHEIIRAIEIDATLLIYQKEIAEQISKVAVLKGRTLKIHLKVDTGMSRQGLALDNVFDFIVEMKKTKGLFIEAIATHFAIADELGNTDFFKLQMARFADLKLQLGRRGILISLWHAANSAALLAHPETHFNFVRPGFSLYGGYPSESVQQLCEEQKLFLRPALSFKTKIAAIKILPPGSYISYGCTYRTQAETKIAILPIGYNDGLSRRRSNRGNVLIHGRKAPILGNVCMNITIVDVSKIPDLNLEDEVVVMGEQIDEKKNLQQISMYEIANEIGGIPYEVLTSLREGLPRYLI